MRIIVCGDIHLKLHEKYGTIQRGFNSRLKDKLVILDEIIDYAIKNKSDMFVFLGDIFDKINPPEFLRFQFVKRLKRLSSKMPVYILVGNHDTDNNIYSLMSESVFSTRLIVMNKPKVTRHDNLMIGWLPWSCQDLPDKVKLCNLIFTHIPIKGFRMGPSGVLSDGIPMAEFNSDSIIVVGHYHKFQKIDNFICPGSIAKTDFGEERDMKYFLELLVSDRNIRYNSILINDRPFLTYKYSESSRLNLDKLQNSPIVRLLVIGKRSWLKTVNIQELKTLFYDLGASKVLIEIKPEADLVNSVKDRIKLTDEDLIKMLLKQHNISDDNYLKYALKLISEV